MDLHDGVRTDATSTDGWAIVARNTVMDGLVVDWFRSDRAYEAHHWALSASRDGVLVGNGVALHTIPEEHVALADSVYRLLATRNERDREQARRVATHQDDGSRGLLHGKLVPIADRVVA